MSDVLTLALPFFGLILLGYASARLVRIPEEGLAWMNFFLIYVALPALFYKLIAQTPIEQLANWRFILTTTMATYVVFAICFAVGMMVTRGNMAEATIQGVAGSYSNIGYMGPGLTLAVLGTGATVPTALIFCFDNALLFTMLPLMMALAGSERTTAGQLALGVARRVLLHPFILATIAGVIGAAVGIAPPRPIDQMLEFLKNAAAPCALFAMGVTVAMRPLKRVPREIPFILGAKLILHPVLVWLLLGLSGDFEPVWVYTAVLMAALPPALNVFVMARQYESYVERASSIVLVGTMVSVLTLTGFIALVTQGILPVDPFPGI